MKLTKALLRWYKSFHLNYRGEVAKGETTSHRPWNAITPKHAPGDTFPFIEIPIEADITTIVGGNESGKSHLLNAISKVMRGRGVADDGAFKRTDLCHYAGIRTKNVEAWPHIGLQFSFDRPDEAGRVAAAVGANAGGQAPSKHFTLILAPEAEDPDNGFLFLEPNEQAFTVTADTLKVLRGLLPTVQYIESRAILPSEIPLARLIAAYGDEAFADIALTDRRSVEKAVQAIRALAIPAQPAQGGNAAAQLDAAKKLIQELEASVPSEETLEMRLFREILDIKLETLRYLYGLGNEERGYTEGQIAKWNDEIADRLNLEHFWHQDEQFSLRVNFKDGIIYFEIQDKTDSIYTFGERSQGLKFFLSYYLQAKAMEMSSRNRNSIILMDEPDSALSIVAQRNLLSVFESLVSPESSNQTCQLVYTTHSPYLINRNFPRRIRVIKKEDAEEGSQFIEQARARRYEPVRTALGIDNAPSLFLGADNVLLEGATDQFILTELIRVFATPSNVGEFLDLNSVIIVSADGVGNIESVLDQSRWADEPIPPTVVLVDNDPAGIDVIDKISAAKEGKPKRVDREFAKTVAEVVGAEIDGRAVVTIEDIIPESVYRNAVLSYVRKWLPDTVRTRGGELESLLTEAYASRSGGLVAQTKTFFEKTKPEYRGDYDKMGVFQEVVAWALGSHGDERESAELAAVKKSIVKVCDFVREGLSKSRAITARYSTSQAVKRVIHDFERLNKDNVPITTMQKMLRRLEREVAGIGPDGDALVRTLGGYLAELDKKRSMGQERLVGKEWGEWAERLKRMKSNPLAQLGGGAVAAGA